MDYKEAVLFFVTCAIYTTSQSLLRPESMQVHRRPPGHSLLPTGSPLTQPGLDPDPKVYNHYLTSYKYEFLTHEFEQDTETE